ncbi:dihydrofolate reductase [Filimonas zeae]|uniref:Diacylglycerol kinase n=1 Tax=Filimonas zeae TaxID=1737353 RepID=A0A917MYA5_9BACT|nr:dihydrofolate reductase family protein [Filimonas zeae]MDR6340905.1 dihydrofolate reductase [Filimonas zeae]GGH77998.1 diacylglycerol kinase [Filimonas zeae]
MSRKLVVYIATSVDGYIAKPNDDLGFLSIVEQPGEDYGYAEFIKTIDTVIVGRRTYDWVMAHVPEFSHADKNTYVITRTARPDAGNTKFYTGDIKELVTRLKNEPGKNIFCDGGAEVIHTLLQENMIDEMVISLIPILVGDGIKLFKDGRPEQVLQFVSVKHFEKGLVQLYYKRP